MAILNVVIFLIRIYMKSHISYFKGSFIFTICSLLFAFGVGFFESSALSIALSAVVSAAVLGLLEVSVSLDNAVVNAKLLEKMNSRSVRWFLTWGIAIAVFGMRVLLPILIVSLAAGVAPWTALHMALTDQKAYQHHIESVHIEIMGFGAAFLLMVFFEFLFNEEKDTHWIPVLESFASMAASKIRYISSFMAIGVLGASSYSMHSAADQQGFVFSAVAGLVSFYAIHWLKDKLEASQGEESGAAQAVAQTTKLMIGSLIYIEILDASFSFDGVIAAFAVTNDFLVIGAGLGIGAMFVRSLTVYLVDQGTMAELIYLEHAAMWGIGWLVLAMTMSAAHVELGEIVVAGVAAAIIAIGGLHSYLIRKDLPVEQLEN